MVTVASENKIFLVKFDRGYYAEKQPNYEWSFTDDPLLAKQYKSFKTANERAEWGDGLKQLNQEPIKLVGVETFLKTTTIRQIKE